MQFSSVGVQRQAQSYNLWASADVASIWMVQQRGFELQCHHTKKDSETVATVCQQLSIDNVDMVLQLNNGYVKLSRNARLHLGTQLLVPVVKLSSTGTDTNKSQPDQLDLDSKKTISSNSDVCLCGLTVQDYPHSGPLGFRKHMLDCKLQDTAKQSKPGARDRGLSPPDSVLPCAPHNGEEETGNHSMLPGAEPKEGLCGPPECELTDFHQGPCTSQQVVGPRQRRLSMKQQLNEAFKKTAMQAATGHTAEPPQHEPEPHQMAAAGAESTGSQWGSGPEPEKMQCPSWKNNGQCEMFKHCGEYCAFDHPAAKEVCLPVASETAEVCVPEGIDNRAYKQYRPLCSAITKLSGLRRSSGASGSLGAYPEGRREPCHKGKCQNLGLYNTAEKAAAAVAQFQLSAEVASDKIDEEVAVEGSVTEGVHVATSGEEELAQEALCGRCKDCDFVDAPPIFVQLGLLKGRRRTIMHETKHAAQLLAPLECSPERFALESEIVGFELEEAGIDRKINELRKQLPGRWSGAKIVSSFSGSETRCQVCLSRTQCQVLHIHREVGWRNHVPFPEVLKTHLTNPSIPPQAVGQMRAAIELDGIPTRHTGGLFVDKTPNKASTSKAPNQVNPVVDTDASYLSTPTTNAHEEGGFVHLQTPNPPTEKPTTATLQHHKPQTAVGLGVCGLYGGCRLSRLHHGHCQVVCNKKRVRNKPEAFVAGPAPAPGICHHEQRHAQCNECAKRMKSNKAEMEQPLKLQPLNAITDHREIAGTQCVAPTVVAQQMQQSFDVKVKVERTILI